jgi:hypothetical protein
MKFVKPLVAIAALGAIASPFFLSSAASAEIIIRPFARRPVIFAPGFPVAPRQVVIEEPTIISQPVPQSYASSGLSNLYNRDGWVNIDVPVEQSGRRLYLNLNGEAKLDYAEIKFGDGQVERVNLHNQVYNGGNIEIADFGHNRHVSSVD